MAPRRASAMLPAPATKSNAGPKRLTRAGAAHAGVVVSATFATPPDMKRKSKKSKSKSSSDKLNTALLAAASTAPRKTPVFSSPLGTPDHQSTPFHFGGVADVSEMGVPDTPTPAPIVIKQVQNLRSIRHYVPPPALLKRKRAMQEREAAAAAAELQMQRPIKRTKMIVLPQAASTPAPASPKPVVGRPSTPPRGSILRPIVNSAVRAFRSIAFGALTPMPPTPVPSTPTSDTLTTTTVTNTESPTPVMVTSPAALFAPVAPVTPVAPTAPAAPATAATAVTTASSPASAMIAPSPAESSPTTVAKVNGDVPEDTGDENLGAVFTVPDWTMDTIESEHPTTTGCSHMSVDTPRVPVYTTTVMAQWNLSDWDEFLKTEHGYSLQMLYDSINAMEHGQLPPFVEHTKKSFENLRQRAIAELESEKKGYHARLRHQAIKEVEEEKSRLREQAIKELDEEIALRRAKADKDFEEKENRRRENARAQPAVINPVPSAGLVDSALAPSLSARQLESYERQKTESSKHLPKNPSQLRNVSRFSTSTVGSQHKDHSSSDITELTATDETGPHYSNDYDPRIISAAEVAEVRAAVVANFAAINNTNASSNDSESRPISATDGTEIPAAIANSTAIINTDASTNDSDFRLMPATDKAEIRAAVASSIAASNTSASSPDYDPRYISAAEAAEVRAAVVNSRDPAYENFVRNTSFSHLMRDTSNDFDPRFISAAEYAEVRAAVLLANRV